VAATLDGEESASTTSDPRLVAEGIADFDEWEDWEEELS